MNLTLLKGYPDRVGKRFTWCGFGTGPTSYTGGITGGDAIVLPVFQGYIDSVEGCGFSVSGNYFCRAQPSAGGARAKWVLRYFTGPNSTEVTNSTNLSAETFQLSGLGGFY